MSGLLPRLISQAAMLRLAAVEDISGQALATVEGGERFRLRLGVRQSLLDQGPASADPMTIAAVDELVGSA